MRTLSNSEDQDKMPHNVFHQGPHYLLRQKRSLEKKITFLFENYNPRPFDIYNGLSQNQLYQTRGKNPFMYKGLNVYAQLPVELTISLCRLPNSALAICLCSSEPSLVTL